MAGSIIRRKVTPENPVYIGARFGRLVVTEDGWEQVSASGACSDMVKVKCDCGGEKFVRPRSLPAGHVKSCGCLQREAASITVRARATHGHAGRNRAPEYGVYQAMLSRCYNPNVSNYARYGGRGITVCERWRGSGGYERFLSDMGRRPNGGSIERVNGDGSYAPENCRWADATEQANNRRSNRLIVHDGERMTLTQLAKKHNRSPQLVADRIDRGWSVQKALETAVI